ncbi:MAG: bifunctional riboflavin kinase/FAD synthetase [Prevotellaceae bacterium]|jgi:riboflavin kinase/FMN adenylyltransferase|nr:bifunctional riboflavin kinase/FAD synthetase [Prevotellaceae bacterium]
MQVYQFPDTPPVSALAVTTGFFDGVHCGHAAVLSMLKRVASASGLPSCVATYSPHPRIVLGKDSGLRLLCSSEEKQQLLALHGVDYMVVIPFSQALSDMQPDSFFERYLVNALHVKELVVGFDHNMGKDAMGDFEKIKSLGEIHHVAVHHVAPHVQNAVTVSATKIRRALQEGRVADANKMLGYRYSISGDVCKGMSIGRTTGYPTANIHPDFTQKMLPKDGAYAVQVQLGNTLHGGMLNIGTRSIFGHPEALCIEAHIFDFSQDIYGRSLTAYFIDKLRDIKKIRSADELKKQLEKDEAEARKILAGYSG